jgi:hypothetical protein
MSDSGDSCYQLSDLVVGPLGPTKEPDAFVLEASRPARLHLTRISQTQEPTEGNLYIRITVSVGRVRGECVFFHVQE